MATFIPPTNADTMVKMDIMAISTGRLSRTASETSQTTPGPIRQYSAAESKLRRSRQLSVASLPATMRTWFSMTAPPRRP
jgi:hypothetical protein